MARAVRRKTFGEPVAVAPEQARLAWLKAQRLDCAEPFGAGPQATPAAVRHLGYVQIDTINVVERCHHHILFTRIPGYRREHLAQAQSVDKTVFEYWTHALSYVPTDDMAIFARAMRVDWQRRARWLGSVKPAALEAILARIEREGALTVRDVDLDEEARVEKTHLWASRKPTKRALQLGFFKGLLTISRRDGMLKTYELAARHFGWGAEPPEPAREAEVAAYLLDRALRAQGIVSLDSICHLEARRKPAVARLIAARVRRGALVPVAIEGAGRQEHWAEPATLASAPAALDGDLVHILSPFDPLIIQRKRLALFFGYEHRFEAYVPKEKRVLGYFALPVLVGDRIAAAIDLKADRDKGRLQVQRWTWTADARRRGDRPLIEAALDRFEAFQLVR